MTGVRREQGDKRRIRGAHLGLKRMFVEGMKVRVDRPYSWQEFSDALVRQAVGDAVRSLPPRDADLVKLAYFGGLSNGEISASTGMPQATIERKLRRAIETIAHFVERGHGLGQRALGAVAIWLSGRWLADRAHHLAEVAVVASATVIVVAQPVAPIAATSPPVHETRSDIASTPQRAPLPVIPLPVAASRPEPVQVAPAPVQVPPAPVQVPAPVLPVLPPLPPLPVKVKTPQL